MIISRLTKISKIKYFIDFFHFLNELTFFNVELYLITYQSTQIFASI